MNRRFHQFLVIVLLSLCMAVMVWLPWKGPQWGGAVLFAIVVAASVAIRVVLVRRQWRRRQREIGGLCLACGYDLRATADQCPECGTEKA
jgi:hypothetical protein